MTQRVMELTKLKRELSMLPATKLREVRKFVRELLPDQKPKKRNVKALEGIWEGLGWEKVDIEAEVKKLRKESSEQILKKFERWDT